MQFKYLAPLVTLLPLITFAAVNAQPQLPATASDGALGGRSPLTGMRVAFDAPGNQTMQFLDAAGNYQFQVGAWGPYEDLDVVLEEAAPSDSGDQGDTLGIVHVFHNDIVEITFVKDGISCVVQSPKSWPESCASALIPSAHPSALAYGPASMPS